MSGVIERARHALRTTILGRAQKRYPVRTTGTSQDILLIRPDHLGDVLFLGPALDYLRRTLPEHRLVLAVGPWSHVIASRYGSVDEVLEIPFPGFARTAKHSLRQNHQLLRETTEMLAQRQFNAVGIFRDDHWWAGVLATQAGIPIRVGHDHPLISTYLTDRVAGSGAHWVDRNLSLAKKLTHAVSGEVPPDDQCPTGSPLRWSVSDDERRAASTLLREQGISGAYVVVHPGSGADVKLWSDQRWAEAIDRILTETGHTVILTGSPAERMMAERIKRRVTGPVSRVRNLAGETTFPLLGAILASAKLVLGVDSGPMHLAVATSSPTIHLYGPSNDQSYGPWGEPSRHRVLRRDMTCSGCEDLSPDRPAGCGCMLGITTALVGDTALSMLAKE